MTPQSLFPSRESGHPSSQGHGFWHVIPKLRQMLASLGVLTGRFRPLQDFLSAHLANIPNRNHCIG